jgi:hypothetical protein
MDEIENARIACEISAIRIKEIQSTGAEDYPDIRAKERTLEIEKSNLRYRKEILVRTTLEHSIDIHRNFFFKNARALQQDPNHILKFVPEVDAFEFPSIANLKEQVKYWQVANERLNMKY